MLSTCVLGIMVSQWRDSMATYVGHLCKRRLGYAATEQEYGCQNSPSDAAYANLKGNNSSGYPLYV
jgi:hypothetical protein